jgi:hypothetical protein
MKNSSRFDPTIDRNFTRSRSGFIRIFGFFEDPALKFKQT